MDYSSTRKTAINRSFDEFVVNDEINVVKKDSTFASDSMDINPNTFENSTSQHVNEDGKEKGIRKINEEVKGVSTEQKNKSRSAVSIMEATRVLANVSENLKSQLELVKNLSKSDQNEKKLILKVIDGVKKDISNLTEKKRIEQSCRDYNGNMAEESEPFVKKLYTCLHCVCLSGSARNCSYGKCLTAEKCNVSEMSNEDPCCQLLCPQSDSAKDYHESGSSYVETKGFMGVTDLKWPYTNYDKPESRRPRADNDCRRAISNLCLKSHAGKINAGIFIPESISVSRKLLITHVGPLRWESSEKETNLSRRVIDQIYESGLHLEWNADQLHHWWEGETRQLSQRRPSETCLFIVLPSTG
ncbi:hypothetical protein GQR58_005452 [Nymphon striatum]|nr:hypothetical protein GQR58_005452 [Nymphon striatum]